MPDTISSGQTTHAHSKGTLFPTTRWTLVATASAMNQPDAREALAQLCEAYWYPVYAFIRRKGHSADDAQDLAQGFFVQVLSGTFLDRADQGRGAFRAFLIHAIKYFLADAYDKTHALKRGAGKAALPFETPDGERRYQREPAHGETPERIFERRWAMAVLERAMDTIRQEFVRGGRLDHFQQLQPFLANQATVPYAQLAAKLEISESALKAGIHRIRKKYREALRAEVESTVASSEQVDAELRYLILALQGA